MNDLSRVEITEEMIDQALEQPSSFGYSGDRPMFETWSLGPTIRTRDSGLVDQSNAATWEKIFEEAEEQGLIEPDSWEVVTCSHWGPGWITHLAFQAIKDTESREPTNAFKLVMQTVNALQDYPLLDDSDHSRRVYEAAHESIRDNAPPLADTPPENWEDKVWSWIWNCGDAYKQETLSDTSDGGSVYVPRELIEEALEGLGWAYDEDAEEWYAPDEEEEEEEDEDV